MIIKKYLPYEGFRIICLDIKTLRPEMQSAVFYVNRAKLLADGVECCGAIAESYLRGIAKG